MKKIPLTQGKFALVDDEDYAWLMRWKWYAHKESYTHYSMRGGSISMHRVIMNAPKGAIVDHINHNGLDNRKKNLRICSASLNVLNKRGLSSNNTTGVLGLYRYPWIKSKKWLAALRTNGKQIHLGYFKYKKDAIRVLNAFKKKRLKDAGG